MRFLRRLFCGHNSREDTVAITAGMFQTATVIKRRCLDCGKDLL